MSQKKAASPRDGLGESNGMSSLDAPEPGGEGPARPPSSSDVTAPFSAQMPATAMPAAPEMCGQQRPNHFRDLSSGVMFLIPFGAETFVEGARTVRSSQRAMSLSTLCRCPMNTPGLKLPGPHLRIHVYGLMMASELPRPYPQSCHLPFPVR